MRDFNLGSAILSAAYALDFHALSSSDIDEPMTAAKIGIFYRRISYAGNVQP